MRPHEIRIFFHRQPFDPFMIHVADGRSFHIRHPDFVSFSSDSRAVTLQNDEQLHEVVSTFMIVSLRPLKPVF
jgi:hypothetical protein